jgi:hypothetical protein
MHQHLLPLAAAADLPAAAAALAAPPPAAAAAAPVEMAAVLPVLVPVLSTEITLEVQEQPAS